MSRTEYMWIHVISLIHIGAQATSYNPQNGQFYKRRICKLGDESKMFKKMVYEIELVERQRGT